MHERERWQVIGTMRAAPAKPPLLEVRGLEKTFPGVRALLPTPNPSP